MKIRTSAIKALRNVKLFALGSTRSFSMNFEGAANELLGSSGRPPFIYGTAWKKDRTKTLVIEAVKAGFTAFDTAAQPKHYQEELVGSALRAVLTEGSLTREQIYVC